MTTGTVVVAVLHSPDGLILCRKSMHTVVFDDCDHATAHAQVPDGTPVFGYKSIGHCWSLPLLDLYLEPWAITTARQPTPPFLTLEGVTLPEGIKAEKAPLHTINSLSFLGLDAYIAWAKLTNEVKLGKWQDGKVVWEE